MDPYQTAKDRGVLVVVEPLGTVYGYYSQVEGHKLIHVSDQLPEYFQRYVVAHMLYGALHRPDDMLVLKEKKATQFTDAEKAANAFAMHLLLDGEVGPVEELMDRHGMTEADRKDLAQRLTRIWGYQGGTSLADQIRHVIDTYKRGERTE